MYNIYLEFLGLPLLFCLSVNLYLCLKNVSWIFSHLNATKASLSLPGTHLPTQADYSIYASFFP